MEGLDEFDGGLEVLRAVVDGGEQVGVNIGTDACQEGQVGIGIFGFFAKEGKHDLLHFKVQAGYYFFQVLLVGGIKMGQVFAVYVEYADHFAVADDGDDDFRS